MPDSTPLEQLRIADPETYVWVKGRLALMVQPPSESFLNQLATETIWALSLEPGMGRAVANGVLSLGRHSEDIENIALYMRHVRQAAETGPTLARILATHLVAVLTADTGLLARFTVVVNIMRGKGTYTLSEPLEVLGLLLDSGDILSAKAFLDLLETTFGQDISYNRSVRLVHLLPQAVRGFSPRRRTAQIAQLCTVVREDQQLIDPFLEGMQKGVALLAPRDLEHFVAQGLSLYRKSSKSGAAFLGLSSSIGRSAYAQLLKAVPMAWLKGALDRYVSARLGRARPVKPMSVLDAAKLVDPPWVCSDGRFLYLRDEIDRFDNPSENAALAKMLVRLEAGFFEYRTYRFDLERAADRYPLVAVRVGQAVFDSGSNDCDAVRFAACFDRAELANDMFDIFELGRVMFLTRRRYPGLMRDALSVLRAEVEHMKRTRGWRHLFAPLYCRLVLDCAPQAFDGPMDPTLEALTQVIEQGFRDHITLQSTVETCAALVCSFYDRVVAAMKRRPSPYTRWAWPFGWRLRWELISRTFAGQAGPAARIKARLAEQGVKIYRSDLQETLTDQQGRLSMEDIQALVVTPVGRSVKRGTTITVDGSDLDLAALFKAAGISTAPSVPNGDVPVFRYPEWDVHLQDYLNDHARVQAVEAPAAGDGDFYRDTLEHHRGLVMRMRRAFELLKPQGLVMLRPWPEGDAFDHRALIDFAIDRRAGRLPSDRLFIKRLKQERDVAVLLLVDLSRSTSNLVPGGQATVLGVAKEALVLFCEALQVVGDIYAIAGFSGTGRHAVDYFSIKAFQEPLDVTVKARISGLSPQRSTRMGAALRHATAQLARMPSRVRLLIMLSDGFPNDLGYKGEYAVADTRRAVQEARACNVHVKAITVNIGSDPQLDDLYGRVHHHVIGDVRELPDKLLRLYGILTRRG